MTSFLPSFTIVAQDTDSGKIWYNPEDLVDWQWVDTQAESGESIGTIECIELINSWT